MTTAAKAGFGASFTWNSQAVAEISEISGIKITTELKDVTSHSSSGNFREQIATLSKAENLTIKGNFISTDSDGQVAMRTDCSNQTSRTGILTFPSSVSATFTFTGYIVSFEITGFAIDGSLEFIAEIAITGEPTLALTASGGLTGLTGVEENAGGALDFIPNFANGTYIYTVAVNTASTYIKFTPTAASHTITILNGYDSSTTTVATGNQSGELDLDAANTVTKFTITVTESTKVSVVYIVYVTRAAA
jgi:predicted secreted protein